MRLDRKQTILFMDGHPLTLLHVKIEPTHYKQVLTRIQEGMPILLGSALKPGAGTLYADEMICMGLDPVYGFPL